MLINSNQLAVGVDYSISSPSVCILTDSGPFFVFFSKHIFDKLIPSQIGQIGLSGQCYPDWQSDQERYEKLASRLARDIKPNVPVAIEAFAFGASGRVFDIAEATQTFKHKLYMDHGTLTIKASPNTLKKHFCGNGHAKKPEMAQAFYDKTGIWIHEQLGCKVDASPATDIVDSYAAALWGLEQASNGARPRSGERPKAVPKVRRPRGKNRKPVHRGDE